MEPTIFDQKVSVFQNGHTTINPQNLSLGEILQRVKTGHYKNIVSEARRIKNESEDNYKAWKSNNVPGFTLSVLCRNRIKNIPVNEKLIEHTGILQIDIDHLPTDQITPTIKKLKTDPFIFFVFRSLGGDGIKAGLRIPKTNDENVHRNIAIQIEKYILEKYGQPQDPSVKNLFRLFFIGFDPDIYINPNAKIYEAANESKQVIQPKPEIRQPNTTNPNTQDKGTKHLLQAIETVKTILNNSSNGNRHHARLKAGYLIGGYIGGGLCTESEVLTEIESTILANTTKPDQALKNFRDAMKSGQSNPIDFDRLEANRKQYLKNRFDNWHHETKSFSFDPDTGEVLPTDQRIKIIDQDNNTFGVHCFKFQLVTKKTTNVYLTGVYHLGLFELLQANGYFKRYISETDFRFIRDQAGIIEIITPVQIRDFIFEFVKSLGVLEFNYSGTPAKYSNEILLEQIYKQSQNIFSESFLSSLIPHTKPILTDNPTEIYFPFKNAVIRVTKAGVEQMQYNDLNQCIWKSQIIQREINLEDPDQDKYFRPFLYNVSDGATNPNRYQAFCTAFGYLLHNYSNQSGRAVIAYDMELTSAKQPQGGTGKGIFAQAFRQLRKSAVIDGKKFDPNDRFCFQAVTETTQAVYIDDVKPNFDFLRLNSALTEGLTIEQKNLQSVKLPIERNPNFYITANSILQASGHTFERRVYILEFAAYYKNIERQNPGKNPIEFIHGKRFFDENWTTQEWNQFFSFAFECATLFFIHGLHNYNIESVHKNKVLQTTNSEFYEFVTHRELTPGIEYDLKELFSDFKQTYFENENFDQKVFTEYLKKFAIANNLNMERRRSNHVTWIKFKAA